MTDHHHIIYNPKNAIPYTAATTVVVQTDCRHLVRVAASTAQYPRYGLYPRYPPVYAIDSIVLHGINSGNPNPYCLAPVE